MTGASGVPLDVAVSAPGLVVVSGELDLATAPRLRPPLMEAVRARPERLVVDVSGLRFVDASGISVLLEAQQALARAGGVLLLRRPPRVVRRVVELLDLSGELPEEG